MYTHKLTGGPVRFPEVGFEKSSPPHPSPQSTDFTSFRNPLLCDHCSRVSFFWLQNTFKSQFLKLACSSYITCQVPERGTVIIVDQQMAGGFSVTTLCFFNPFKFIGHSPSNSDARDRTQATTEPSLSRSSVQIFSTYKASGEKVGEGSNVQVETANSAETFQSETKWSKNKTSPREVWDARSWTCFVLTWICMKHLWVVSYSPKITAPTSFEIFSESGASWHTTNGAFSSLRNLFWKIDSFFRFISGFICAIPSIRIVWWPYCELSKQSTIDPIYVILPNALKNCWEIEWLS